jgi:replicative DNA helicase
MDNSIKSKRRPDISTLVYGKIPPQARDLEEAILGAIMLEKDAFDLASDILKPECFYVDSHQRIFSAMFSLRANFLPIDILTVVEELRKKDELEIVGGPYFVTKLTNSVVSSANIEAHSRILKQKFFQRELIRISSDVISDAYEDSVDVFELMDYAGEQLSKLIIDKTQKQYVKLEQSVDRLLNKVEEMRHRADGVTGVPTGIYKLDDLTGGWQNGDLIILAARPSIGKSAVAGNLARLAALSQEKPTAVGIFSLEMSDMQWSERLLAAESLIDAWKIKRGRVSDHEMQHLQQTADNRLRKLEIFIDDSSSIDLHSLRAKARRMVNKDKVGMIIVDYLQLMNGDHTRGSNREQEISQISRGLKGLAKELQIPIIALSQLNRGVEKDGKPPKLSDLRESGAIEQDADVVIFLVPPSEGDIANDSGLKDSILIKISKHRSGPLDQVEAKFVKNIQRIMSRSDYDDYMDVKALSDRHGGNWVPVNGMKLPEDELPF